MAFNGTDGQDIPTGAFTEAYGGAGDDGLFASATGSVLLDGGSGHDVLVVTNTATLEGYGGAGNDRVLGGVLNDLLYGGEGSDWLAGGLAELLSGSLRPTPTQPSASDVLSGDGGTDALYGFDGNDALYGGDGDDNGTALSFFDITLSAGLYGGDGDDYLDGGRGSDFLVGGLGRDALVGGLGADRFGFEAALESGKGQLADVIRDFCREEGDKIEVSGMGDFDFIGKKKFKGDGDAELNFKKGKLSGDADGDGQREFMIKLTGVEKLQDSDFIL